MLNLKQNLALLNTEYSEKATNSEQPDGDDNEVFASELSKFEEHVSCQDNVVEDKPSLEINEKSGASPSSLLSEEAVIDQSNTDEAQIESSRGANSNHDVLAQINASQKQSTAVTSHTASHVTSPLSQVAKAVAQANEPKKVTSDEPGKANDKTKYIQNALNEHDGISTVEDEKSKLPAVSQSSVSLAKSSSESHKSDTQTKSLNTSDVKDKTTTRLAETGQTTDDVKSSQAHVLDQVTQLSKQAAEKQFTSEGTKERNQVIKLGLDGVVRAESGHNQDGFVDKNMLKTQFEALTSDERKSLSLALQQALNSHNLAPEARKRAESALQELNKHSVEVEKINTSDEIFAELGIKKVTSGTGTSDIQGMVKIRNTAVNGADNSEKARTSSPRTDELKALQEQASKEQFLKDEMVYKSDLSMGNKPISSAQIEQLFKVITQPTTSQSISNSTYVDYNDTALGLESSLIQQSSNQAQATSTSYKPTLDPEVQQAINITRNDAAKVLQEKVSMMLNLNNKEAEIRLDPPELGSMQIRIRSDAEQAQVNFVVQNQQAKEILEQSMPKLKEMLAEQGIMLGESNIQQGQQGNSEQQSDNNQQQGKSKLANENGEAHNSLQLVGSRGDGSSGIDYYA